MPISLFSVIADTGEEPSSLHNLKHIKHTHATRVQNTTLYSDGTTHSQQHRIKWVKLNGSPCANNHCSTRYEQSFRHNKHTHTYQKAATDQHFRHHQEVHRKLHQGTHSLNNIYKSHILTTSIQNWRSTRWRPFTNTIQHIHCIHTTTKSTSSGHGLRR